MLHLHKINPVPQPTPESPQQKWISTKQAGRGIKSILFASDFAGYPTNSHTQPGLQFDGQKQEKEEETEIVNTIQFEDITLDPAWLSPHRGPPDESKVTQKMKLTDGDSEILSMPVDTLLMNQWPNNEFIGTDVRHFLTEENAKLALVDSDDDDDIDQKPSIDFDDLLLTTTTNSSTNSRHPSNPVVAGSHPVVNNSLAELKPLPPFTGYTSSLVINGISGHHYHAIATAQNSARVLETNNNSVDTTNQNVPYYPTDHVVSSSTMDNTIDSIKSESNVLDYELPSDDLAALIGSAMADTTCATGDDSNESWLDLEYWISINCQNGSSTSPTSSRPSNNGTSHTLNTSGSSVLCQDTALQDFVTNTPFPANQSPVVFHHHPKVPPVQTAQPSSQHHHSQPTHTQRQEHQREINTNFSHMPLLQNRLQNGPPKTEPQDIAYNIVSECPSPSSSTPYLAHSPPCHVVSTSDIGFMQQVHSSTRPSPEGSFAHTTTPSKKSRSRNKSKMSSNIVYNEGNLGKEKTVHRCNICNRGFLNKSNIKVHLRTHTGEKPFRCDVCGKAFRQKAHLIKHAQIHKRVGRDWSTDRVILLWIGAQRVNI